jgi:hypothetical protein
MVDNSEFFASGRRHEQPRLDQSDAIRARQTGRHVQRAEADGYRGDSAVSIDSLSRARALRHIGSQPARLCLTTRDGQFCLSCLRKTIPFLPLHPTWEL